MGDINLLGMIRKLKSSLSGFVGKNDKASKSAFGVVKIGDNISVSSGKISIPVATAETYGVVKDTGGGGVTLTELVNRTTQINTGANVDLECSSALTNFNLLVVWITNNDGQAGSTIIPVSTFLANTSPTLCLMSKSGAIDRAFLKKKADDDTNTFVNVEVVNTGSMIKTMKIFGI